MREIVIEHCDLSSVICVGLVVNRLRYLLNILNSPKFDSWSFSGSEQFNLSRILSEVRKMMRVESLRSPDVNSCVIFPFYFV